MNFNYQQNGKPNEIFFINQATIKLAQNCCIVTKAIQVKALEKRTAKIETLAKAKPF